VLPLLVLLLLLFVATGTTLTRARFL